MEAKAAAERARIEAAKPNARTLAEMGLLAFAVELAMLAGFALAGWGATPILWLRIVLAVALPGIAITMWAVWAARSARDETSAQE